MAEAAARLGVDDESLDSTGRALLESVLAEPEAAALLSLAEGSLAPTATERLAEARALWAQVPATPALPSKWTDLQRVNRQRRERPWRTGWAAAEELRRWLGLSPAMVLGNKLPQVLEDRIGWPVGRQVFSSESVMPGVDTVHVQKKDLLPAVITTIKDPAGKRFRLARALYHFLFSAASGETSAFVDSPWVPGEFSEANAFAAELLAPAKLLGERTPPNGAWDARMQRKVAHELRVSPKVIAHQIENRGLGFLAG